ncbi:MAG: ferrous iron transport protein B [Cytophagales bacterium]|nr:ferrous iron transport protein B [Cytophagales bacterium]
MSSACVSEDLALSTSRKTFKWFLLGNPNGGKSSVFNGLTGLNQRTSNFAGVTMQDHRGFFRHGDQDVEVVDLPGAYSLYPRSKDEAAAVDFLLDGILHKEVDGIVVVANAFHLQRSLFFFTQIRELGIPTLLVLNMMDEVEEAKIEIDVAFLSDLLKTQIVCTQAHRQIGLGNLKKEMCRISSVPEFRVYRSLPEERISSLRRVLNISSSYLAFQYLRNQDLLKGLGDVDSSVLEEVLREEGFGGGLSLAQHQAKETLERHRFVREVLDSSVRFPESPGDSFARSDWWDKIFAHKFWGLLISLSVLALSFQALFYVAEPLMWGIEMGFSYLANVLSSVDSDAWWLRFFVEGLIPGVGGIVIFLPQIVLLFLIVGFLEDTGYMSRMAFLSDRWMRRLGLSGRSLVPLVSGMACAIPAVMCTRGISNSRARLLTTLAIPFMSCSARLPVYTLLIGVVIPNTLLWGIFHLQGVVLFGMYLFGVFMAALVSCLLHLFLPNPEGSDPLLLEIPRYRLPSFRTLFLYVYERSYSFVWTAGRIIILVSIILWVLSSVGYVEGSWFMPTDLSHSYAGYLGKKLQVLFSPLGYDWKISLAILSSFPAREIFVGIMSILYGAGHEGLLRESLIVSGSFTPALSFSLIIFYALSMQCFSTLSVVRAEQGSWKWPVLQFVGMGTLAYLSAWAVYSFFS